MPIDFVAIRGAGEPGTDASVASFAGEVDDLPEEVVLPSEDEGQLREAISVRVWTRLKNRLIEMARKFSGSTS